MTFSISFQVGELPPPISRSGINKSQGQFVLVGAGSSCVNAHFQDLTFNQLHLRIDGLVWVYGSKHSAAFCGSL